MALLKDRYGFEPSPEVRTFTPDLQGLIGWLETQDGATEYNWHCIYNCVVGRFAAAMGKKPCRVWNDESYVELDKVCGGLAAYHQIGACYPWIYAAALTRARALRDRVSA